MPNTAWRVGPGRSLGILPFWPTLRWTVDGSRPSVSLAAEARDVLDVTGLTVCPGFIDVHSHSDALPFWDEPLPAKILQGVTTEITGNCGSTPFPVRPIDDRSAAAPIRRRRSPPCPGIGPAPPVLDRLEEVGPVSNVAPLVGHNAVRVAVMGYDNRAPTADELLAMQRLVGEALEDGAVGLSTGLIYAPGCVLHD